MDQGRSRGEGRKHLFKTFQGLGALEAEFPLGTMVFKYQRGGGGTVLVTTPVLDIGESINNRTKRAEIRYIEIRMKMMIDF